MARKTHLTVKDHEKLGNLCKEFEWAFVHFFWKILSRHYPKTHWVHKKLTQVHTHFGAFQSALDNLAAAEFPKEETWHKWYYGPPTEKQEAEFKAKYGEVYEHLASDWPKDA